MTRLTILLASAAALAACSAGNAADTRANPASSASATHPTVVELYQSQGCSSCPPANAAVNAIATRPDVLALSFAVTYWDQLGWKDTFDDPAYTKRQWDYAHRAGRPNVATPQVIVNGHSTIVGSNPRQLAQTIAKEGTPDGGPALSAAGNGVHLAAGKAAGQMVWVVRFDPKVRQVAVRAGENGGRTLPHRNIVRQLVMIGTYDGTAKTIALPPAREPGLSTAVLTQAGSGGAITGALRIS